VTRTKAALGARDLLGEHLRPGRGRPGELRVRTGDKQLEQLLWRARPWPERAWAIESAGGLGYLLAQQLIAAGDTVLDVPPSWPLGLGCSTTATPTRTTPNDARSVAIVALRTASGVRGGPWCAPRPSGRAHVARRRPWGRGGRAPYWSISRAVPSWRRSASKRCALATWPSPGSTSSTVAAPGRPPVPVIGQRVGPSPHRLPSRVSVARGGAWPKRDRLSRRFPRSEWSGPPRTSGR
jgi:hypothetical protein